VNRSKIDEFEDFALKSDLEIDSSHSSVKRTSQKIFLKPFTVMGVLEKTMFLKVFSKAIYEEHNFLFS